jgi:hypothetical protein
MGGLSTWLAGPQSTVWQRAGFGQLAGAPGPTVLDSFVAQSGYNDMIYGDESVEGPPPYFDFLPIGAGMSGMTGLTGGNQDLNLPTGSGDIWDPKTGTYTAPPDDPEGLASTAPGAGTVAPRQGQESGSGF